MSLTVSRILHAGYIFECDETKIAFDPIFENPFSRNCYAFPNVTFDHGQIRGLKLNAVFISHFHDDHCSFDSLDLVERVTPIYIYCVHEEMFSLVRELGFINVFQLKLDESIHIGSFEITPRRALDSDVDSIFQITAAGLNVLNVVDSWIDPETLVQLAKYAPWDMVLWPFQTMREIEVLSPSRALPSPSHLPSEWIEQLRVLKPRFTVPSSCQFRHESWSWYNRALFPISYRQFHEEVEAALPETQVVKLNPSVGIVLDRNSLKKGVPLNWIIPVGPQDLDYSYDETLKAPTTVEIAKNFAKLTIEEAKRVHDYCRSGLLLKYRSLDSTVDYFAKPKLWRLSVIDHAGAITDYTYRVHRRSIERDESDLPDSLMEWKTEVPIAKFFAALELGEALTSMYVRINDTVFSEETERALGSVDVIDDPLARCLFNGEFGAYQIAQLNHLNAGPGEKVGISQHTDWYVKWFLCQNK